MSSPATTLRESSTAPLILPSSSPLLSQYTSENNSFDLQNDCNRFGWHKQSDRESYQYFTMDHGPLCGRDDNLLHSAYADYKLLHAMPKTEHLAKQVTEMKASAIKFSDAAERFPSQT